MPVSRDDVINAYRFILGREPENEEVLAKAMNISSIADLRKAFFESAEFKRIHSDKSPPSIGRFLNAQSYGTDLTCTQEQMDKMLARIASAWREFGETEPHWSVLTNEAFRSENIQDNIEAFYRSGIEGVEKDFNFIRRLGRPLSFANSLDFGCGVGRLTLALASYSKSVIGIDISEPHVKLANQRAKEQGIDNVRFQVMQHVDELQSLDNLDLIISRIVLQHNPPPVMASILRYLLRSLATDGIAIIQLPTYIETQKFSVQPYLASTPPKMEMNALPQPIVFDIIAETGCRCFEVREDNVIGNVPGISQIFAIRKLAI